jgi:hypothetical protein
MVCDTQRAQTEKPEKKGVIIVFSLLPKDFLVVEKNKKKENQMPKVLSCLARFRTTCGEGRRHWRQF